MYIVCARRASSVERVASSATSPGVQGYLARKKQPPPPRTLGIILL